MRPRYEKMTIAEMRAFCAALWEICRKSYKSQSDVIELWKANKDKLPKPITETVTGYMNNLEKNKNQLELLGVRDEQ